MPFGGALMLGAGVGAGVFGSILGGKAGKRTFEQSNYAKGPDYDSNAFNYGGSGQAATQEIAGSRGMGYAAQARQGPQVNYGAADQSRGLGLAARGGQGEAGDLYRAAALGQGPSAAQAQLRMGLDQATASQYALANSARGGALGLAGAQQQAQSQAALMAGQAAQQAAVLRAQEQQAGMAGYAGVMGQQRGQDLQAQGLDAQQAQYQAGLEMQQRGLNSTDQRFFEQQAMEIQRMRMQGAMARQDFQAAQHRNTDAARAELDAANSANAAATVKAATGAVSGGLEGYMRTRLGGGGGGGAPGGGGLQNAAGANPYYNDPGY